MNSIPKGNHIESTTIYYFGFKKFSVTIDRQKKDEYCDRYMTRQLWVVFEPGKHLMECPVYQWRDSSFLYTGGFTLVANEFYELFQLVESQGWSIEVKEEEHQKPDRIDNPKEIEALTMEMQEKHKKYIAEKLKGDQLFLGLVMAEVDSAFETVRNQIASDHQSQSYSMITRWCNMSSEMAIERVERRICGLSSSFAKEFDDEQD